MSTPLGIEHCLNFINCNLQPPSNAAVVSEEKAVKCAITISRQSGCGAHVVAEKLAVYLGARVPAGGRPWTVFDRNLVEAVLADHHMPERYARFMPEDRVSEVQDMIDELFGLHPDSWTLVQRISATIVRLAKVGNAIILGRGANLITADLPHMLHVRMVASLERRVESFQVFEQLSRKEALERIQREDLGRERYLKKHFEKNIDDPLLYHLVVNTDLVSLDDAARLIGDLALRRAVEVKKS
jgi:cytidylate kinase